MAPSAGTRPALAATPLGEAARRPLTTRVSVNASGEAANEYSYRPVLSGDGRYVAFASLASNLVPHDTNRSRADWAEGRDVFVYDRRRRGIRRVNVSSSGAQANQTSDSPRLSTDGRVVAFSSWASNLVPGDTNGTADVFVHDLRSGTTTRVSIRSDGGQASGGSGGALDISADGRFVAFSSAAPDLVADSRTGITGIFLHDRLLHTTVRVAADPGGPSGVFTDGLRLSGDARVVAFTAVETAGVDGPVIHRGDIYAYDTIAHTTEVVSLSSSGQRANHACLFGGGVPPCEPRNELAAISEGRFVTFLSTASNLVPGDTNGAMDVFVRDRRLATTTRVSVASDGEQACPRGWRPYRNAPLSEPCKTRSPDASSDGRFIAFFSHDAEPRPRPRLLRPGRRRRVSPRPPERENPAGLRRNPPIRRDITGHFRGRPLHRIRVAVPGYWATPHPRYRQLYVRDRLARR